MARKKTHAQYLKELSSNKRRDIRVLEPYAGSLTKIWHGCTKCQRRWRIAPNFVLLGHGCLSCSRMTRRVTKKEFQEKLVQVHDSRVKLITYGGSAKAKSKFKCSFGHSWEAVGSSVLSGCGCLLCGKSSGANKRRMSDTDYKSRLHAIFPSIEIMGQYKNARQKLRHRCICGLEWEPVPGNLLRGHGCPICSAPPKRYSRVAIRWLTQIETTYGINIQHAENGGEFRVPGTPFSVDGFCSTTNTIFEFYGDCYHGNPKVFAPNDQPNPYSDRTTRELYQRTMKREKLLKRMGYNVVSIWERDYARAA